VHLPLLGGSGNHSVRLLQAFQQVPGGRYSLGHPLEKLKQLTIVEVGHSPQDVAAGVYVQRPGLTNGNTRVSCEHGITFMSSSHPEYVARVPQGNHVCSFH